MEVKEFITTTLNELAEGLEEAKGENRSFKLTNIELQSKGHGNYGLIQFDLAVTAKESSTKSGGGGVRIAVASAGVDAKSENINSATSRIKFVVEARGV